MTRRLLLIRGLGHSGTTILDLALGAHPQVVGLGEAARILERPAAGDEHRGPAQLRGALRFQRRCTCGVLAAECPVWGPMLTWLPAHEAQPLAEKMQHLLTVLEAASETAPTWVVDSYQGDFALPFHQDDDLEIRILHLTRDLRSWVHSRSRDGREPVARSEPLLRWCRINARHERWLLGGKPVSVGSSWLNPVACVACVHGWRSRSIPHAEPAGQQRPCASGNRMRFDAERSETIRYDGAWMTAPTRSTAAGRALAALNRRLVYSEGAGSLGALIAGRCGRCPVAAVATPCSDPVRRPET